MLINFGGFTVSHHLDRMTDIVQSVCGETTCCWACTQLTETAVSHFLRVCADKQQVVSGEKRPFLGIKTANRFVSVGWKDLIVKRVSCSLL